MWAIADLDLDTVLPAALRRWRDDFALWALRHEGGRHLAGCVVQLTAPELTADQLLGVTELAEVAGVAASTLRAYLARGEGDVPAAQASVGGRSLWSQPVAEDWAEERRRSRDGIAGTMADQDHTNLSIGVTEMWEWFTRKLRCETSPTIYPGPSRPASPRSCRWATSATRSARR